MRFLFLQIIQIFTEVLLKKRGNVFESVLLCGNDGVITSDCAVPYLDASV